MPMMITGLGYDGRPTGNRFSTKAPPGKVRAVVHNQDTGHRFYEDYLGLDQVREFSDCVLVTVYDDRGRTLSRRGERWDE